MKNLWAIVNARIITLDPKLPRASGLIVEGNKIGFVGSSAQIKKQLGHNRKIFDLQEKTVLPGFIDSHTHLAGYGIEKTLRLDLSQCRNKRELVECVRNEVKKKSSSEVVVGIDWDQSQWTENYADPRLIFNRAELDRISPRNPLVLRRVCGHIAFANSRALTMINRSWSIVDRKSGLLLEDVVAKVNKMFPVQEEEIMNALRFAIRHFHSLGITSVHEMVDGFHFKNYLRLFDRSPRDRIRVYANFSNEEMTKLADVGLRTGYGNEFLRIGGIKIFADGSIGARTAAMFEDYAAAKNNRGILLYGLKDLTRLFEQAEENGFQVLVHAIGDRAVNQVLQAMTKAGIRKNSLRHRIEHAEILSREREFESLARLGVLLSVQPNFIGNWGQAGGMYETYLGRKRWFFANRLRSLRRRGLKMMFGSDCMPPSPMYGIHWAANHPVAAERIGILEAIKMYCQSGAYGSFEEGCKGVIRSGTLADFVVLDRDPDTTKNIGRINVLMTVLDGSVVFERNSI